MALPKKAFGVQMDAADLMAGGVRNLRLDLSPWPPEANFLDLIKNKKGIIIKQMWI